MAASFDLSQRICQVLVDGNFMMADSGFQDSAAPFSVPWTGLPWYVGGGPFSGSPSPVDLAYLYVAAGTPIDLSDPNVQAGFVDPEDGTVVRISPNGRSAIPGIVPQIFATGGMDMFPLNLPPYEFTVTSATDPGANSFQVVGQLVTSQGDPYI